LVIKHVEGGSEQLIAVYTGWMGRDEMILVEAK
jgi:hypothetical protein